MGGTDLGLAPGGPLDWSHDPAFSAAGRGHASRDGALAQDEATEAGSGARIADATAGRGAILGPMALSKPTWSSGIGLGHGISERKSRSAGPRRQPCGRPTLQASDRLDVCIQPKEFEYDWNGVILGPDLVWRTDDWLVVHCKPIRYRTCVT